MARRKRRGIKKAGRSPLVSPLFDVSPPKSPCCFLLSHAYAPDAARAASRLSRRFRRAFKLLDDATIIINEGNFTSIVWECWGFRTLLVCDLLLHAYPSAVFWRVWAVVVDTIKSACHPWSVVVISSGHRPLLERREAVPPLVADHNAAPAIPRVIRSVLVVTTFLHAAPHAIQAVFLCWDVGIERIDALFQGFCDRFWSNAYSTRKRPTRSQALAGYASYRSALTSAYPFDLIAAFIDVQHRPPSERLPSEVFSPLASSLMKNGFGKPAPARLLATAPYIFYRCADYVPAGALELPDWPISTVSANGTNRSKSAERLPRVVLYESSCCRVFHFRHHVLLGGRYV